MPVAPTRIMDSANGVQTSPAGPISNGTDATYQATGVPTSATSAMLTFTVTDTNSGSTGGYISPHATGTARPTPSLSYAAGVTTMTATVALNSSGQFNFYTNAAAGPVNITIDLQGYFDGTPSLGGFTPLQARLWDSSTAPNTNLAPGASALVQLTGVGGLPAASASNTAFALQVEADTQTTGTGSVTIWSDDVSAPSIATISYDSPNSRQSNMAWVRPGASTGKVWVKNDGAATVRVALCAEGYVTNPAALPPAASTTPTMSGSRSAASMISHNLTDRSGVQINPTNGNLLYTQALLNLAGVGQGASVGVRYNALGDARPTLSTGLAETQLFRDGSDNITYTAPDGAGYVFVPTGSSYTGSNAAGATGKTLYSYSMPNGINATLVRVGAAAPNTEYDLTFHPGQTVNVYADTGSAITLNSTQDVTGANKISYTYAAGKLTGQTDTQGRTISYAYTDANNTTQPSTITDNSLGRTITLTYGATTTPANGAVTKSSTPPARKPCSATTRHQES